MPLFSDIDISDHRKAIAEKISLVIDPVLNEIPVDPILVNYLYPDKQVVRLFSYEKTRELQQMTETSRSILKELKEDNTGISIALKYAKNLSPSQERYKDFLLKMSALNGKSIDDILNELQQVAPLLSSSVIYSPLLLKLHRFIHRDIATYIQDFQRLAKIEGNVERAIAELIRFREEMFLQQTQITSFNHGQLTNQYGVQLTSNQIFCPFSKERIKVAESLRTRGQASNLLAIFIALSQLAKLKDADIENFLKCQASDYLEQANEKLLQYLRFPIWFNFSPLQQRFLAEAGAQAAKQQLNYRHLWSEEKQLEDNVLSVLIDYSKQDWNFPVFGLFISGHWRRHHHEAVSEAIKSIRRGEDIVVVLEQLKNGVQKHPSYNSQGSLTNRLEFIERKLTSNSLPIASLSGGLSVGI
ncbi:DUF5617 domain-containing protein [Legionella hackeliae]|uniref:RavJ-like C-terminal domain-containing protein n=1 Tax=Legionella hackeliae TaxID=449 RepID=A0A0A8USK8_LEGHA|nr:DUF5617 domain-containing protein [Legionella hackeliae]KTD10258.1 hypothetical protein Lhac_2626 [Legionella hackeliae]CEK09754.1 protein of unknown function [Legionella hackeliae]STX49664.1 Uncharacterised protein [Legionella hackeliae]